VPSSKITFFAHPEEVPQLIFTKKYSKNPRHPYAQFGVEIMLISFYLAKIWPENHLKRRDLAKIRYNALSMHTTSRLITLPWQRHCSCSSKSAPKIFAFGPAPLMGGWTVN